MVRVVKELVLYVVLLNVLSFVWCTLCYKRIEKLLFELTKTCK